MRDYESALRKWYLAWLQRWGLAVAALIVAVSSIAFGFFLSVPALLLAIVALFMTWPGVGSMRGRGLAIAAVMISSITLIFWDIALPIFLAPYIPAVRRHQSTCFSNMHQCGIAVTTYMADYDAALPPNLRLDGSDRGKSIVGYAESDSHGVHKATRD